MAATNKNQFNSSISAGGIVMIVIAAVGILIAFTTIICLFVTSKKRNRVNQRLESVSSLSLANPRNNANRSPPSSGTQAGLPAPLASPHVRTMLPMFPDMSELSKRPPTYDEAMRMTPATTPVSASQAPLPSPSSGTPPPAFDEVSPLPPSTPTCRPLTIDIPNVVPTPEVASFKANESILTVASPRESSAEMSESVAESHK